MTNQLIADMNSLLAALQVILNIVCAVAAAILAIYLLGIILLCLSERQRRSVKTVLSRPATNYSSARLTSSVRNSTAMRV